jgi:hypothetical protein
MFSGMEESSGSGIIVSDLDEDDDDETFTIELYGNKDGVQSTTGITCQLRMQSSFLGGICIIPIDQ